MSGNRRFFVGGNWKMNGSKQSINEIVDFLAAGPLNANTDVVVGPPACYLEYTVNKVPSNVMVAAQNCYKAEKGAFTGEISPQMILDLGVKWVILGHSERRNIFGEDSQFVAEKTKFALENGLSVIPCVGEKLEERESNRTLDVITEQMSALAGKLSPSDWEKVVIAYEPVWAIGTGRTATPDQAQDVHAEIRTWISKTVSPEVASKIRIIYGGSVKGENCQELAKKPDIDGFLVGGASLKPEFINIVNACS